MYARPLGQLSSSFDRRVREAVTAVDKYYIFPVYVCNLSHPAHKAHAPYYVICGMSDCHISLILSVKRHDFLGGVIKSKCVF